MRDCVPVFACSREANARERFPGREIVAVLKHQLRCSAAIAPVVRTGSSYLVHEELKDVHNILPHGVGQHLRCQCLVVSMG